jgi:flagellar basal-body rod modification protein FlgD
MDDFMKLLAAQMQNQDCLNPSDNTEFVSQMAQFSSLSAMQALNNTATTQLQNLDVQSEIAYAQYGASLVGKTVELTNVKEDGTKETVRGVVESSSYIMGNYNKITVNGNTYDLAYVNKVITDTGSTGSA